MTHIRNTLLIDGDVFAYKAAAACEKIFDWDGDNVFPIASLSEGKRIFEGFLADIMKDVGARGFVIALSDVDNFRKDIFPGYKSNRIGRPRPIALKPLRDWVEKEYKVFKRPFLEGDDVLGILATSGSILKTPHKVIVSVDKDMLTVPGFFYDFGKGEGRFIKYEEANLNHMRQTLTGDTTDGYGGCPGVGKKTADKILEGLSGYKDMWVAVVGAYKKAGLTEDNALTQAHLARILRNYDYDFKNKRPILWKVENERD